jgi:serine/threonine-protein kinase
VPASASPPPLASSSSSAAASAPAPASDAPRLGTGLVRTASAVPHRRIFVDDVTVGQTPDTVTVKCGMRAVKLGSSGRVQRLDVPCGGEVTLSDR